MREITQEEINAKIKAHKLWLDTDGNQGERAVFSNVLIKSKNFFRQNLREVKFENATSRKIITGAEETAEKSSARKTGSSYKHIY